MLSEMPFDILISLIRRRIDMQAIAFGRWFIAK